MSLNVLENEQTKFAQVIAIDGPSGSGKSTIAKDLARTLGVLYIDTGAMFRALGFFADQEKIDLTNTAQLQSFLDTIDMDYGKSADELILINGVNLTEKIREHNVSKLASIISQLPEVRNYLLNFQRNLAQNKICVMEGRDIGTVVFPNSFCKFFITASADIRASRRLKQLQEAGDCSWSLEQIIADVKKRDDTDMNREVAPLKKAADATLLDTTELALVDIVKILANEVKFRASHLGYQLG